MVAPSVPCVLFYGCALSSLCFILWLRPLFPVFYFMVAPSFWFLVVPLLGDVCVCVCLGVSCAFVFHTIALSFVCPWCCLVLPCSIASWLPACVALLQTKEQDTPSPQERYIYIYQQQHTSIYIYINTLTSNIQHRIANT